VICRECGFDWDRQPPGICADVRSVATWPALADTAQVRTRPERRVWSALEYAAHTRDALRFYDERIVRALTEDRPQLHAYGFDEACERLQYNTEAPETACAQLTEQALVLARRLEQLDEDAWSRVAIGSQGGERTVLELARRAAHEARHHAQDIRRVLASSDAT
jgi:DinB superfamily